MNFEQIKAVLSNVVTFLVTMAVTKGWIPDAVAAQIGTIVLGLASVGYTMWTVRKTNQIATVAAMPEVVGVKMNPTATAMAVEANSIAGASGSVTVAH